MSLNFVEKNQESIALLNKKVAEAIGSLNIDTSGDLSIAKCIKVTGEINKAIKNIKQLSKAISDVETSEKAGIILAVTLETLNSEEVKSKLSESQRKQIENFCQDTETVETVIGLVDWIADETLESLDVNNDGIVTDEELQDGCLSCCLCVNKCGQGKKGCGCYQPTGCCACCPGFVKFLAKLLCCGKKSVKYQDKKPVTTTDVDVDV
tara:strand:+ start:190 stop:813 length:624 start_codon:yes stop_codon:yes gene_type:complete